jgi:uncharacterized protein (DUF1697 family)
MSQSSYVALLRGINVGGKNVIRMTELRKCFEKHGFGDVATYIQSGNVLFTAARSESDELARRIEDLLAATFNYRATVVLRSRKQMQYIVGRAPLGFGKYPARYRYDVIFLRQPLAAATAMKSVPISPGVDEAQAGVGVLYFSRLISKASQSRLSRLVSLPIYQSMTIRNWNTTTKLLQMMESQ